MQTQTAYSRGGGFGIRSRLGSPSPNSRLWRGRFAPVYHLFGLCERGGGLGQDYKRPDRGWLRQQIETVSKFRRVMCTIPRWGAVIARYPPVKQPNGLRIDWLISRRKVAGFKGRQGIAVGLLSVPPPIFCGYLWIKHCIKWSQVDSSPNCPAHYR